MKFSFDSKRVRRSVAVIGGAALLLLGFLAYSWSVGLPTTDRIYVVSRGMTMGQFTKELRRDGVLSNRYTFLLLAYLRGQQRNLKAGEYRFRSGISQWRLLDQVVSGKSIQYSLLIPEGWNFREMRKAIHDARKLQHSVQDIAAETIMTRLGKAGIHPEGRFYPDTYHYSAGTSDLQILQTAYDRMERYLAEAWEQRERDLPYKTPYEALIMASIVEKETGKAEERPLIAGVFVNRLRKGMRLQTDPTVIYGMGARFDGNLRKRDLLRDTPYNTYTRKGLPPTPIAMPGGDAIRAVLHPAKTDHLFFVSRGNGSHQFSATLREHQKAVRRYQLKGGAK